MKQVKLYIELFRIMLAKWIYSAAYRLSKWIYDPEKEKEKKHAH